MDVKRKEALEVAIGQIDHHFGKGTIMRLGEGQGAIQIEAIPTGSLVLDLALGVGGVPRGRVTEIYGAESSGKSTLAYHIMAEAQRMGGGRRIHRRGARARTPDTPPDAASTWIPCWCPSPTAPSRPSRYVSTLSAAGPWRLWS